MYLIPPPLNIALESLEGTMTVAGSCCAGSASEDDGDGSDEAGAGRGGSAAADAGLPTAVAGMKEELTSCCGGGSTVVCGCFPTASCLSTLSIAEQSPHSRIFSSLFFVSFLMPFLSMKCWEQRRQSAVLVLSLQGLWASTSPSALLCGP